MNLPTFNSRILVLGDITIDRDILVTLSATLRAAVDEPVYDVRRRYTTAGGAAIGARFLATFNEGDTYLAGFSAPTAWVQGVASAMEQCRIYDNCPREVKLICVWTAEGRGGVISRLVRLDEAGTPVARLIRWDDESELILPSYKRDALPDCIKRVHKEAPFDGIIINDLERGTLDNDIVRCVASLAADHNVPMVVDPRWSADRYRKVGGLALTPNLKEWCNLVGEGSREGHYRKNLDRPEVLKDMARESIKKFPKFRYHVITCGVDGVVLIGPVGEGTDVSICRVQGEPAASRFKQGPGDVFAAQFLAAYLQYVGTETKAEPKAVHEACRWGLAAATAYLNADWQRMPTRDEVKQQYETKVESVERVAQVPWVHEVVWERLGEHIDLDDMTTPLPNIFTSDEEYRNDIQAIVAHVEEQLREYQLQQQKPEPLLIGGDSGNGKSAILEGLVKNFDGKQYPGLSDEPSGAKLRAAFNKLRQASGQASGTSGRFKATLVAVDEADEHQKYIKGNIDNIDEAAKSGILFVFAGCEYTPEKLHEDDYTELYTRSQQFVPSSLTARPWDVPVILAAITSSQLQRSGITAAKFDIEKPTIDHALSKVMSDRPWAARNLARYARKAVSHFKSHQTANKGGIPRLAHPDRQNGQATLIRVSSATSR